MLSLPKASGRRPGPPKIGACFTHDATRYIATVAPSLSLALPMLPR
jgi:hypothetical protein